MQDGQGGPAGQGIAGIGMAVDEGFMCLEIIVEGLVDGLGRNRQGHGQVAAGQPMLAVENIDAYFPIPAEYMPNAESFMLKVKGESMVNAGIFDGDNIIVERCSTAQNGEMVVALVDDSATVKTFYKEDGHIRLQPENDAMDPIIVPDCKILGKVFGVFRLFR